MTGRRVLASLLAACLVWASAEAGQGSRPDRRRVAIFVVDGLRPDSINTSDTPTIARLRDEGAEYLNSHSVFPTVTRVNAASLATGAYPVLHGIVGNSMFVPAVNPAAPFDTGDYLQLLKLETSAGRTVGVETLGEMLQRRRATLVTVSSGSTGNGFLLNPAARHGAGVVIHGLFDRGRTAAYPAPVSRTILERYGSPPPDPDDLGQMRWTDGVLREYVLPELRPDVVIDWMGPLDSAQHEHGVGSPEARTALREIDHSLAQTLDRIDENSTDVIVTSDHGFAGHQTGVDAIGALVRAGLKSDRQSTDVIVASQSQSLLLYVASRQQTRVASIVRFLQEQPWADVIFTRRGSGNQGRVPGTLSLDLIGAGHQTQAPDIVVSLAWTPAQNAFGVPGMHTIQSTANGPLSGGAAGHGGLNPWVVHNTLIAWGPDFKKAVRIDAPAAMPDLTPTVLTILDLPAPSGPGRGRVLRELLIDGPRPDRVTTTRRTIRTSNGAYRASIEISRVDGHDYVDSGSRQR